MLKKICRSGAVFIPWPTIIDGEGFSGQKISEHAICETRCTSRECVKFNGVVAPQRCSNKLTYYQQVVEGFQISVYGVLSEDKEGLPHHVLFKQQSKGRTVTYVEFSQWVHKITGLLKWMREHDKQTLSDALAPLHDTIKWAREVLQISEKILDKYGKGAASENFEKATNEERALFKTAQMLVGTFDQNEIVFNPESAAFGGAVRTDLYRLIDKYRIVLNMAEGARANKRILLSGNSYQTYHLYESFPVLLFSLLQNALKYSLTREVEAKISDEQRNQLTNITVSSVGPLIENDEIERLFQKGYRGKWASRLNRDGMGLGLFIAKAVADAHGTKISVRSEDMGSSQNGIPLARNVFSVDIHSVGSQ